MGVDPGVKGGIAIIDEDAVPVTSLAMPDNDRSIWQALRHVAHLKDAGSLTATLEQVSSSPQMGVVSAFRFGGIYRALRMGLIGNDIDFIESRPQTWQRAMGCLSGGDKNVTKHMAMQLFPMVKMTHMLADAFLLAEYTRRLAVAVAVEAK
jgi:hypothetical protein